MQLKVLDLFSGIGGISYGLEATGAFRTIAFCEIDPFCRLVLEKHWPDAPIWEDVRELSAESIRERPDIIAGGFPCQPHSVAGKRKGQSDERHLWPEFARLVRELRPTWVLAENVPGIRSTAADEVIGDLEAEGYAVWPLVVGADDVGAPHRRKRVWFVARRVDDSDQHGLLDSGASTPVQSGDRKDNGVPGPSGVVAHRDGAGLHRERGGGLLDGEREASGHDADGCGERDMGDPEGPRLEGHRPDAGQPRQPGPWDAGTPGALWPSRPGEPQHKWEEPRLAQFEVGSATDGLSLRLVRRANREALRAYGNSVVPQVVYRVGLAIAATEEAPDGEDY